ncbi:MAG: type II toxin-antitoxin system VapC family toxin [Acidobacteriota bacterium]
MIDTCILLDILEPDPEFGESSARLLDEIRSDGLEIAPVIYVELAPAFGGSRRRQDLFLSRIGFSLPPEWERADTETARAAWARFIHLKRTGKTPKKPLADLLIGSFAHRRRGLVTRNPKHFSGAFPDLKILVPP